MRTYSRISGYEGDQHLASLSPSSIDFSLILTADPLAVDFITSLLQHDPGARPPWADVLSHPWLSPSSVNFNPADYFDQGLGYDDDGASSMAESEGVGRGSDSDDPFEGF